MKNIYFKFTKINEENEDTYLVSKIMGSPAFPTHFLENNHLEEMYFVMQLNLSELSCYDTLLPKEGMLYFFLDITSYPYEPIVIYTNEEITTVYDNINEGFEEYGDISSYKLEFTQDKEDGHIILGDIDPSLDLDCEIDTTGYIMLLNIDSLMLPEKTLTLGNPDGWYIYLIKEEDLKKQDFSKVKFVDFGS